MSCDTSGSQTKQADEVGEKNPNHQNTQPHTHPTAALLD